MQLVVIPTRNHIKRSIAWTFGNEKAWALRVAECESKYNINAKNGTSNASGLFQFMPNTFYANASRAGIVEPDLWDWKQQIIVAGWMIEQGQHGQWECK